MATAQREGGYYRTDKGKAVDAEGKEIEGAPKPTPDTDPSNQPGAQGALSSEERLGVAIAAAIKGEKPKGAKDPVRATDDDDALPTIKELAGHVAGLKTVAEVKAMAKRDDRVSAEPIYEARVAELEEK